MLLTGAATREVRTSKVPWERGRLARIGVAKSSTAQPPKVRAGRPEAVKKFNGRDALLRVRYGKPNTDAEHRVPTESGLQA